MLIQDLYNKKLISPPNFLPTNVVMLCRTGSVSYGCSTDNSDEDIVGICIPPKEYLFPSSFGYVQGFDHPKVFEQWQQHHIQDEAKEYDLTVYNIAKYFRLCTDGNPNMIDSLFVPRECVVFSTRLYEVIRNNRKLFLSKKLYAKFKGYLFSQAHKMTSAKRTGKRKEIYDEYGYDLKFAMHSIRLCLEIEQILQEGDLDLRKNSEILKSIRKGTWQLQDVKDFLAQKEPYLEKLYQESELPYIPREEEIKELLIECLKMHYGDLSKDVTTDNGSKIIAELDRIVERYR